MFVVVVLFLTLSLNVLYLYLLTSSRFRQSYIVVVLVSIVHFNLKKLQPQSTFNFPSFYLNICVAYIRLRVLCYIRLYNAGAVGTQMDFRIIRSTSNAQVVKVTFYVLHLLPVRVYSCHLLRQT